MATVTAAEQHGVPATALVRMVGNETGKGLLVLWSHKPTLVPSWRCWPPTNRAGRPGRVGEQPKVVLRVQLVGPGAGDRVGEVELDGGDGPALLFGPHPGQPDRGDLGVGEHHSGGCPGRWRYGRRRGCCRRRRDPGIWRRG
jgi:hypothetical protein